MSHSWHPIGPSCTLSSKLHWNWNIDTTTTSILEKIHEEVSYACDHCRSKFCVFFVCYFGFSYGLLHQTRASWFSWDYAWWTIMDDLIMHAIYITWICAKFQKTLRFALCILHVWSAHHAWMLEPLVQLRRIQREGRGPWRQSGNLPVLRKRKKEFLRGTENAKICYVACFSNSFQL